MLRKKQGVFWLALCLGSGMLTGSSAWAWQNSSTASQKAEPPKFTTAPEVLTLIEASKKAGNAFKWEEARSAAEKALEKAQELKDKYSEAAALNRIGYVQYMTGDLRKALPIFEQAQTLYQEVGDKIGEAGMYNNIGAVYNFMGEQAKALAAYQKGLPIARQIKDKRGESNILICIGNAYNDLGQSEKAQSHFLEALPIVRQMDNKPSEVIIQSGLGTCANVRGEHDKALMHYQQAIVLARELKSIRDEAIALSNIGRVYMTLERYQESLNYYQKAQRLREQVRDKRGIAETESSIATLYAHLRQPAQARASFQRALSTFQEVGAKAGEARVYTNLAAHYIDSDEPTKALECQQKALVINRELKDHRGELLTLVNMGLSYRQLKQHDRARERFLEVRRRNRNNPSISVEATAVNGLGVVSFDQKRYRDAARYYREALPLYRRAGLREYEANALTNLAWSLWRAGDTSGAEQNFRKAIQELETVRSSVGTLSQSKMTFLAGHLSPYYRLIQLYLIQNRVADAFALAQQTKSRALLDLMAGGRVTIQEAMTPQEQEKEAQLRAECDRLNTSMIAEGVKNEVGSKKRFAALQIQLQGAETELATFTDGLYARHPDLAQKRAVRTFKLREAAKLLPKDTALLEYVVLLPDGGSLLPDRLVLFVVTPDGKVTAHTLPTTKDRLTLEADRLRAACANPRQPVQKLAASLYHDLIAPAEKRLAGKKRLIVCPDGALWDVPFAVLQSRGKYLAERFTLAYASSATGAQAAVSARKRKQAGSAILAIANPDFGDIKRFGDDPHIPGQRPLESPSRPLESPSRPLDNPSRPLDNPSRPLDNPSRPLENPSRPLDNPSRPLDLPSRDLSSLLRGGLTELKGTQEEADALRRLYPNADIYTRLDAQESVVKAKASGYRILHLASHAFFNDAAPMLSSIFLAVPPMGDANDGFLTAREIFDLKLNAEMAVLSACQTGRGQKRSGEGIIGLTWALFVAGCPTQILSQWSVDDAATAQLMSRFYSELKQGKSKAASLRTAGMALLRAKKTRHPYYWAPFILVGDWK